MSAYSVPGIVLAHSTEGKLSPTSAAQEVPWPHGVGRSPGLLSVSISDRCYRASATAQESAGVIGNDHGLGDPGNPPELGNEQRREPDGSCGKGKPDGGEGGTTVGAGRSLSLQ